MSPNTRVTTDRSMSPKQRALVIATYLVAFMALLDVFVVILALPTLSTDLGASTGQLLWVVGSYSLSLCTFALSAGALADRYGRKRVFMVGVAMFTAGSLICAVAPDPVMLLVGRFVQGLGAAIAVPATLTLLALEFPEQRRRARMFGGWATVTGTATVIGPTLGSVLIEAFGWPSIFLINLPLGAIALVLAGWSITETANPEHAALDLRGQLLAIVGLGALTYGLINVGSHGWSAPSTAVALAAATGCLVLFGVIEWSQANAMLPLRLFCDRRFCIANLASATIGFTAFSVQVFLPSYLQLVQHHSVTTAGLLLLPWPLSQIVTSYIAGWWAGRAGARAPMALGLALISVSSLGLLTLRPNGGWFLLVLILIGFGVGVGLTFTPANLAALEAVPVERSGTGGAVVNAVRHAGTSLGIAILGLLFYQTDLTAGLHHVALAAAAAAGITAALVLTTPAQATVPAPATLRARR